MSHGKDMTFKHISKTHLNELINLLPNDINIEIDENTEIEILTEEQISIEPSLYKPDLIVRIGNLILMIEYQSTYVAKDDKKRFKVYISNFDYKNNKKNLEIIFLVLSTAEYSKMAKHSINKWDTFTFPIVSLYNINEREIISNIEEKINNRETITDSELIELALTPMMVRGRDNIINQFEEIIPLMSEITYRSKKIKESVYAIALMLGNMYFTKNDPLRKKILGDFMYKGDFIQEYIEEKEEIALKKGKEEGMKEGEKNGKIDLIKKQLNNEIISMNIAINELISLNCETTTISQITGLTEKEIQNSYK